MKRIITAAALVAATAIPALADSQTPEGYFVDRWVHCEGTPDEDICMVSNYRGSDVAQASFLIYIMMVGIESDGNYRASNVLYEVFKSSVESGDTPHEAISKAYMAAVLAKRIGR